ncbi:class I adenylate-forming enzyme family protein [Kitasatospora sp. NPDC057542]|uniref:class I adenylate-forming enzyme family protein n=1 Tax=Streptomycetaceae TaxID=2062 RepID=UPI001CCA1BEF|nr:AMP-binding protein [Streptomyces sp. LS1784]
MARIDRCARWYQRAGVGDGDLVLLTGLAQDSMLAVVVACWSIGAAVRVTPRAREAVRADGATFVATAERAVEPTATRQREPAGPVPEALALVHETSGSTGEPKLARRSVDSLLAEHAGYREGLRLDAADTVRIPVPVAHSFGSGVAFSALLSGCRLDVRPFSTPAGVAADLDRGPATKLAVTPALLSLLTRTARRGDNRPQAILAGAGLVPDSLDTECVTRFGVPVTRGYGSSETGGILIGPRGLGRPIPSVDIVRPEVGGRGELVIRTRTPVLGHAHEPVRTSLRWETGDIVERDASGQVRFVERKPGALRANGTFLDTGPVQAALNAVEGVDEVAFVVLPRAGRAEFEDVFAVVAGSRIDRDSVERALRSATTDGFAPRLRIFDKLPRTGLGKLDRTALTERIKNDG